MTSPADILGLPCTRWFDLYPLITGVPLSDPFNVWVSAIDLGDSVIQVNLLVPSGSTAGDSDGCRFDPAITAAGVGLPSTWQPQLELSYLSQEHALEPWCAFGSWGVTMPLGPPDIVQVSSGLFVRLTAPDTSNFAITQSRYTDESPSAGVPKFGSISTPYASNLQGVAAIAPRFYAGCVLGTGGPSVPLSFNVRARYRFVDASRMVVPGLPGPSNPHTQAA